MDYVKLGRTGLDVSRISLGCMSYGCGNRGNHAWSLSEEESKPITSDPDRIHAISYLPEPDNRHQRRGSSLPLCLAAALSLLVPVSAVSGEPEARPSRAGWSANMPGCRRARRGQLRDRRG